MQITLLKEGKEKTYSVPFMKGRALRHALIIKKNLSPDKMRVEDIDALAELTVDVFNNQFTIDELEEGLSRDSLINTLLDVYSKSLHGEKFEYQPEQNESGQKN